MQREVKLEKLSADFMVIWQNEYPQRLTYQKDQELRYIKVNLGIYARDL